MSDEIVIQSDIDHCAKNQAMSSEPFRKRASTMSAVMARKKALASLKAKVLKRQMSCNLEQSSGGKRFFDLSETPNRKCQSVKANENRQASAVLSDSNKKPSALEPESSKSTTVTGKHKKPEMLQRKLSYMTFKEFDRKMSSAMSQVSGMSDRKYTSIISSRHGSAQSRRDSKDDQVGKDVNQSGKSQPLVLPDINR